MDAHHLVEGHGEEAEGIAVAQVLLLGVGQQPGVAQALDVARLHPQLIHGVTVEADSVVAAFDGGLQTLELELLQVLARQGLNFGVQDHGLFPRG